MKKFILGLCLLGGLNSVNAQNGIENIIVEKYYISNANDTIVTNPGGFLPIGSVTYRIYVDMLPGYKFEAAYGVPTHELRIATTTLFFNNEDRGATTPIYTKAQAANNTVMLDSWLSVGAACAGNFGILKTADNGMLNVMNNDGVLQNADTLAGIPLTTQDGLIAGTPEAVTAVGITTEMAMFDAQNDGTNGPVFSTTNGSWASLNGSYGPDSMDNKVLIAQMTTDGTFSFELNIQIGTPSGGIENYVAQNPVGNEIQIPSLIYPLTTTGVQEIKNKTMASFSVYPNPFKDNIKVNVLSGSGNDCYGYSIYDMKGDLILQKESVYNLNSEEPIDLSFLSKGTYLIELIENDRSDCRRIIKN